MEASHRALIVGLMVVAAAIAVIGGDGNICGVSKDNLMKCKPAVATGTTTPPPPTPECCANLKTANLTCFCNFRSNPFLPFLGIDGTKAMNLPSKCDPNQPTHC